MPKIHTTKINYEVVREKGLGWGWVTELMLVGSIFSLCSPPLTTPGFFLNMLLKACFAKILTDLQDLGRNLTLFNTNRERVHEQTA